MTKSLEKDPSEIRFGSVLTRPFETLKKLIDEAWPTLAGLVLANFRPDKRDPASCLSSSVLFTYNITASPIVTSLD